MAEPVSLDQSLAAAVKNGLVDFTLFALGLEWQASAKRGRTQGWSVRIDADAATASVKALAAIAGMPEPPPGFMAPGGPLARLETAIDDLVWELNDAAARR